MMNLTEGVSLQGGKYKIIKTLGQGSFGITYLAEHTYLGKRVAVKEFFMKDLNSRGEDGSITGMSDSSLSYNYCQKFKKEAVNLSRLDHPNIVRVTDSFAENGTFYYVMDYIDGQNLNEYVKTHRISEAEAVDIIKHAADALIYMHETHHMLHLDLKPGNIMRRDSDGHVFLIDFGLSKHYSDSGQPETSTTIGLGTAGYAPIEQATQAKNGEFRATIDVYALGATLYKLLTGETPPDASVLVSDNKLVENNLRAKGVSENILDTVVAAMKPSINERIQTIRDFQESLNGNPDKEDTVVADTTVKTVVPHVIETVGILHETLEQSAQENKKHEGQKAYVKMSFVASGIVVIIVLGLWAVLSNKATDLSDKTTETSTVSALPTLVNNLEMTINGKECTYTGDVSYKDSVAIADGMGEATFTNGNYYKGAFANGLMHGDCAYYKYANGDTFKGSFVNNIFEKGTYRVNGSGEYFVGSFDNQGQPKKGTWYDKSGHVLEKI